MTLEVWIAAAIFGVIFGVAGQMIRVALGLRKLNQRKNTGGPAPFNTGQLTLSIIYGALAGLTAFIALATGFGPEEAKQLTATSVIDPQMVMTVMAAGYAGADAIEGFVKNHMPEALITSATTANTTTTTEESEATTP